MISVWVLMESPAMQKLLELYVDSGDYCRVTSPFQEHADLILLDASGMSRIRQLRRDAPERKIVVITDQPEYSWLRRARELGADSFWYVDSQAQSLLELLRRTLEGESVFPQSPPVCTLGNTTSSHLTERELEVLKALAAGKTDEQIARMLFVSPRTVKTHIQNMREKTGFRNRTELAVRARGCGLVIPEIAEH